MSDILSQDELDALLAQVRQQEGDTPGDAAAAAADIEPRPRPAAPAASRAPSSSGGGNLGHTLEGPNLEIILALPLDLSVELGRTRMTVHELLQLGQGSVIELNRMASDLIDLTVNGRVIAHGEAVVVNESFGFRVAEVDSLRDRIKKL
jgi:flagellar motor switch protein FliN/FliY